MAEGGLDFGLLGNKSNLQTADYRSAGSNQAENLKQAIFTNENTWNVIHTVTEGKTFYISGLIITYKGTVAIPGLIGVGAAASEVTVFAAILKDTQSIQMPFPTPMKFSSGSILSVRKTGGGGNDIAFAMIGWEE